MNGGNKKASAQMERNVKMMQTRADLKNSLLLGSFALPLLTLFVFFHCIAEVCCIVQTWVHPNV